MDIREAKPEDAEAIAKKLWLPLAREMEQVSAYNELKHDLDIQDVISHKREKIEGEEGHIFLAEEDGERAGFVSVSLKESSPVFSRGEKLKISELFVKQEYRRQGVASKLMSKAEELAAEENCDTVELNVNIENRKAKEFYLDEGFETERERMIKEI